MSKKRIYCIAHAFLVRKMFLFLLIDCIFYQKRNKFYVKEFFRLDKCVMSQRNKIFILARRKGVTFKSKKEEGPMVRISMKLFHSLEKNVISDTWQHNLNYYFFEIHTWKKSIKNVRFYMLFRDSKTKSPLQLMVTYW